ncbi:MAG: TonB-dependent receptor [Gammaproteobacteria bacterium]
MFKQKKLRTALLSAMAASTAGTANAQIEEVVVTATKREQSMQDVPVAVQALQGQQLKELGITNFEDYIQYLPNVTRMGTGPGQNEIYIRGAATEQSIMSISSTQGSAPPVALYLDEQPVSFGGRNLDIYAADMQRIEVLSGPQGTLFGASSQAGTVRLITNKPDHSGFDAGIDASISATRGGEMSNSVEAFINVPINDSLAVRAVAYNENQGGWIDNIQNNPNNGGYSPSIEVINRNDITAAPVNPNTPFEAADNSRFVEGDFNDATYSGGRIGVSWLINPDWDILVQHTQQALDTEGVFAYDPNLDGTSSVNRFNPDENSDDFGLTTWTVNGRMAMLDVVYTGGYLDRDVDTSIDYTGYTQGGGYQVYYLCTGTRDFAGNGANSVPADGACYDPDKLYQEETDSTRMTHELRISTSEEHRARMTAGVFYDKEETETVSAFELASTPDVDANGNVIPNTGAFQPLRQIGNDVPGANAGGRAFNPLISFVNDFTRETEQLAIFGQIEYDITPDVTARAGARWYDIDFTFQGSTNSSFGCKFPAPGFFPATTNYFPDGSCDGATFDNNVTARLQALGSGDLSFFGAGAPAVQAAIDSGALDVSALESDGTVNESDVIFMGALDWRINENLMVFATYSQGFRPPVANRNAARAANNPGGLAVFNNYRVPPYAVTDELENFELGFKSDLFDRRLRFNATGYYSEITDLQTSRFDPSNVAFLVFIENVGDAEILGVDADFQWLATENLTISGAFSVIDTEITRLNPQLQGIAVPVGSELPFTPTFGGNIRARYDFQLPVMGGTDAYVSGGLSYTGSSKSGITGNAHFVEDTAQLVYGRGSGLEIANEGGNFIGGGGAVFPSGRYVQQDYAILNLAMGVRKGNWGAELFVNNVTDKNAQLNIDTLQFTPKVVTNRPRTIGARFSYNFN